MRGDLPPNVACQSRVVEEGDVLRPGQTDHHPQPVPGRLVEQGERRDVYVRTVLNPDRAISAKSART